MIRSTLRAAAAALLVALALAGCGMDSRPVARVGRHTLTVGDFLRSARRSGETSQLPAAQARSVALDELVRSELLLVAAEAHGLDTTSFTRQHLRAATEQALLSALSAQIAPKDGGVTEAELRTFYEWRKTQSDVQLVYAPDSLSVRQALRRIEQGVPMGQVADEFAGGNMLPPGGEMGFRLPGTLPPPLDEAMRTLPVGHIGGPYRAPMGWFLLRVSRRAPAPTHPFEDERPTLENMLRQRKWQGMLLASVSALAPAHHLAVAEDAGQVMFRLMSPGRVGGLPDTAPPAAERARVLARFDGGTLTVGDVWDDLTRPDVNKPNSSQVSSLRDWVRQRALMRLALDEARRRHLDEEPAVAGPLADQMRDYLVRGEYQTAVSHVAMPAEAEMRATWESVKDRYPMLLEAQLVWVSIADTAKAMALVQRGGQGSLRDLAHAVDPSIVVHEERVRFPSADPQWTGAQGTLQRLEAGQWAPPQATPAGFRMTQLLDKVQGAVSWEQLPPESRQSLENNLLERARTARIGAYTDSLRRAIQPVLIPDALRNVPWPAPSPAMAVTP